MPGPWRVKFVEHAVIRDLLRGGEGIWQPEAVRRISREMGYIPWTSFIAHGDPEDAPPLGFHTFCPFCFALGSVYVRDDPLFPGARWQWDGDWERPTLSPSVLYPPGPHGRCGFHCFVANGQIVDAGTPPHS